MSNMKPVRAIDDFLPDGSFTRSLVFQSKTGKTRTITFPSDSMAIILSPTELYDWYGRRIKLDNDVDHVICSYGYCDRGDTRSNEIFLVQKTNGKLSFADCSQKTIWNSKAKKSTSKIDIPGFKQTLTGGYMGHKPIIEIGIHRNYEFEAIDNAIFETPIMQAYFEKVPTHFKKSGFDLLIRLTRKGKPDYMSAISYRGAQNSCFLNWETHRFAEKRSDIIDSHNIEDRSKKWILRSQVVHGDIEILEDGNKLAAHILFHGQKKPIFTDIEVVKHIQNTGEQNDLWWYCHY